MERERDRDSHSSNGDDDEIIFDEEVLPEIEIREYVTLDEILAENPRFLAFSEQDLLVYLSQLAGNGIRGKRYAKLHKAVLAGGSGAEGAIDPKYTLPKLDVDRDDFEELEDYIDSRDRAYRAVNYSLQQIELAKLAMPYTWEPGGKPVFRAPVPPRPYIFTLNNNIKRDNGKFLEFDKTDGLAFISAKWCPQLYTAESYLSEEDSAPPLKRQYKYIKWAADKRGAGDAADYQQWIARNVRPALENVIQKAIKKPTDLHEIKRVLMKHSFKLDDFNDGEFDILVKHVESLVEEDAEGAAPRPKVATKRKAAHAHAHTRALVPINYWDAVRSHASKMGPLTNPENLKQLEEKIANYIAAMIQSSYSSSGSSGSASSGDNERLEPFKLASGIVSGEYNMEDVIGMLKKLNLAVNYAMADKLFKNVTGFKLPEVDAIDREKALHAIIEGSMRDSGGSTFGVSWSDISEIVAGTNTAKYDGSPFAMLDNIFEEMQNHMYNIDSENEGDVAAGSGGAGGSGSGAAELADVDFADVSTGAQDIYRKILPDLLKIREASALPLDINFLVQQQKTYINRPSRFQELMAALPELPQSVATRVCSFDLENALAYAGELFNTALSEQIKKVYPAIYAAWQKACKANMALALTIWWLDLIEASVNKQLNFSVLRGAIMFANMWSPYGAPLEDKAEHGIFQYLTAVAADVMSTNSQNAEVLRKEMHEVANRLFQQKIEDLRAKWKTMPRYRDKTKKIRDLLVQTISAIQANEPVNVLGNFVESYLYLPSLMPNATIKKIGTWGHGCCLVVIGKDYEADIEWKAEIPRLWRLKEALARQRWSSAQRPHYKVIRAAAPPPAAPAKEAPAFVATNLIVQDIETPPVIKANELWLSEAHLQELNSGYQGTLFANDFLALTIAKVYGNLSNKKRTTFTECVNKINSDVFITKVISFVATNLQQNMAALAGGADTGPASAPYLEIIANIKRTLSLIKDAANPIYKYALACALALPGRIQGDGQNKRYSVPTNIRSDVLKIIIDSNYEYIVSKTKTSETMTNDEIQNYITRMREEEKNVKLEYQDVLSNDDRQLLKEIKKIGLQMKLPELNEHQIQAGVDGPDAEAEAEADFRQQSYDEDRGDEQID